MSTHHTDFSHLGTTLERVLIDAIHEDTRILREQIAQQLAQRLLSGAVMLANEEGIPDTNHYNQSWEVRHTQRGASLVNDAPYALVIEHGRRPNRPGPPFAPIHEWVRRKLGVADPKAKGIAAAIRLSIHRKGTPPKRILGRVIEAHADDWLRELTHTHLGRRS